MTQIALTIANELGVKEAQVAAAVALLDEGATVPFIARYRKEVTGSLDDTQLRQLEERLQAKPGTRAELLQELGALEARVGRIRVPLSYADELYALRNHIHLVRRKLPRPAAD